MNPCLCHNCLGRMAGTGLSSHMLCVDVEVSSQFFRGFSHRRKKALQAHYTVTPHWQVCRGVRGQPAWQDCWSKSAVTSSSHPSARRHGSCLPPQDKAAGRHGVWPRPPKHPDQFLWNSSHGFKLHLLSEIHRAFKTHSSWEMHIFPVSEIENCTLTWTNSNLSSQSFVSFLFEVWYNTYQQKMSKWYIL